MWQAWAHQESLLASKSSIDRARKLYQLCVEVNPESVHSWQVFVFTPYICKFQLLIPVSQDVTLPYVHRKKHLSLCIKNVTSVACGLLLLRYFE